MVERIEQKLQVLLKSRLWKLLSILPCSISQTSHKTSPASRRWRNRFILISEKWNITLQTCMITVRHKFPKLLWQSYTSLLCFLWIVCQECVGQFHWSCFRPVLKYFIIFSLICLCDELYFLWLNHIQSHNLCLFLMFAWYLFFFCICVQE